MLRAFGQLLHDNPQHDPTLLQDIACVWPGHFVSVFRSGFRNTTERRCAESRPKFSRYKNVQTLVSFKHKSRLSLSLDITRKRLNNEGTVIETSAIFNKIELTQFFCVDSKKLISAFN